MAVQIKSLSFHWDELFTIATDQEGRTYRVLLTTGRGLAYRLEPWVALGMPTWSGRTIALGHALYPAVEAAEAHRREEFKKRPIDPRAYKSFAADTI